MKINQPWLDEFHELLQARESGNWTSANNERLHELLRQEPEALALLAEDLEVQALLTWHFGGVKACQEKAKPKPKLAWLAVAAALVMLFGYLQSISDPHRGEPGKGPAPSQGQQVGNWVVKAAEGARFEVLSPQSVRLLQGELHVESTTHPAGTFTIETPEGIASAHGTEFILGTHAPHTPSPTMNRLTRILVLSGTVTFSNSLGTAMAQQDELLVAAEGTAPQLVVGDANNAFGLDIYAQLASESEGDLFFSPYSISVGLSMALEGARGQTADQLATALHIPPYLRRIGDDAQHLPFQLGEMHTGHRLIAERLSSSQPDPALKASQTRLLDLEERRKTLPARLQQARIDRLKIAQRRAIRDEARAEAEEIRNLRKLLGFKELTIANALFGEGEYPFDPNYLGTMADAYGTGAVSPCDFKDNADAEGARINQWISERTNGLITDLLPPGSLTDATRMVLVNAIHFKALWKEPFDPSDTYESDFTLGDGTKILSRSMSQEAQSVRYAAFEGNGGFFASPANRTGDSEQGLYPGSEGFTMLEMDYEGQALSMVVLLPRSTNGLAALESKLNARNLTQWIGGLEERPVTILFPLFTSRLNTSLKDILRGLGVTNAFASPDNPLGADFSGMTTSSDLEHSLYLNDVLHQAVIKVGELGTEAAAATAMTMMPKGKIPAQVRPFVPYFGADHPFIYLIRDKQTGTILFLGRVTDPR